MARTLVFVYGAGNFSPDDDEKGLSNDNLPVWQLECRILTARETVLDVTLLVEMFS